MSTYRLNADDLNASFIETIRTQFNHKEIEITIVEEDATEFLRSSPKNHERLLRSIERLNNRDGLIELDISNFD